MYPIPCPAQRFLFFDFGGQAAAGDRPGPAARIVFFVQGGKMTVSMKNY